MTIGSLRVERAVCAEGIRGAFAKVAGKPIGAFKGGSTFADKVLPFWMHTKVFRDNNITLYKTGTPGTRAYEWAPNASEGESYETLWRVIQSFNSRAACFGWIGLNAIACGVSFLKTGQLVTWNEKQRAQLAPHIEGLRALGVEVVEDLTRVKKYAYDRSAMEGIGTRKQFEERFEDFTTLEFVKVPCFLSIVCLSVCCFLFLCFCQLFQVSYTDFDGEWADLANRHELMEDVRKLACPNGSVDDALDYLATVLSFRRHRWAGREFSEIFQSFEGKGPVPPVRNHFFGYLQRNNNLKCVHADCQKWHLQPLLDSEGKQVVITTRFFIKGGHLSAPCPVEELDPNFTFTFRGRTYGTSVRVDVVTRLCVNHKDGKRANHVLHNLEAVCYQCDAERSPFYGSFSPQTLGRIRESNPGYCDCCHRWVNFREGDHEATRTFYEGAVRMLCRDCHACTPTFGSKAWVWRQMQEACNQQYWERYPPQVGAFSK